MKELRLFMSGGLMLLVIGLIIGVVLSIFLIIKIVYELKKNGNDLPTPSNGIEE